MKQVFRLSNYHWLVLVVAMAVCAVVGAWFSVNLVGIAMKNAEFISEHGWLAIKSGGFVQLAGIVAKGIVVFGAYILFKAIEVELISRWRDAEFRD